MRTSKRFKNWNSYDPYVIRRVGGIRIKYLRSIRWKYFRLRILTIWYFRYFTGNFLFPLPQARGRRAIRGLLIR